MKIKININNKLNCVKEKLTYKNILKSLVILATLIICYNSLTETAYANGFLSYGGETDPFNNITSGYGQFIGSKYRSNYALDVLNVSGFEFIDSTINAFTNGLFYLVELVSWFGVNIFRFCFTNDIAVAFGNQLEIVMNTLNKGVFNNFFMIVFMISLFSVVYQFWKKNYSAILGQILAVAIIFATAGAFSNGAVKFLSTTTEFSKMIGAQAITAISGDYAQNGEETLEQYSNNVVGTLWSNFVHQPWLMLEFDGKLNFNDPSNNTGISSEAEEFSKDILSYPEGSDEREDILKEINNKEFDNELFDEDNLINKFFSVVVLLIITVIKMIILIAIGMLQIGFQLMSIFMVILVPFVLLIAIVPFFGGVNMIKSLGVGYLGSQFGIIISSFVLGLLILIDRLTLSMFQSWGANLIIALLMQCVCWIMVIAFRKFIILGLMRLQSKIAPSTAGTYKIAGKTLDKFSDGTNKVIIDPVTTKASDVTDSIISKANYAKEYTKGHLGLYTRRKVGEGIDFLNSKLKNDNIEATNDNMENENPNENIVRKPTRNLDLSNVKSPINSVDTSCNASQDVNLINDNINELNNDIVTKKDTEIPNLETNTTQPKENIIPVEIATKEDISNTKNNNVDNTNKIKTENNPINSEVDEEVTNKVEEPTHVKKDVDPVPSSKINNTSSDEQESRNEENTYKELENNEVINEKDINITNNKNKSINLERKSEINGQNKVDHKEPENLEENIIKKQANNKDIQPKDRIEQAKAFLGVNKNKIYQKEILLNYKLDKLKEKEALKKEEK